MESGSKKHSNITQFFSLNLELKVKILFFKGKAQIVSH